MKPKTMNMPLWVSFLLMLLSFNTAHSQEDLSLEELIQEALEQNYQIKILNNNQLAAQNSNTIGNAGMLPDVDIIAERSLSVNNTRQQFFTGDSQEATNARSDATSAGISVNWVVFDGLAMFARKEQLEQLELLTMADKRFFVEQTVADIAQAYYRLTQEKKLLEAYKQALEVSKTRLRFVSKAFEIGSAAGLAVQQAIVDRNTDSSLVITQLAQIRTTSIEINRLLNRDLLTDISPTDSIALTMEMSLTKLLEDAQENNADLTRQRANELVALSEERIARGALFPTVELFGNYGFNRQENEVGFLASSRSFGPEIGIRLRFNLFSGGRERIINQNAALNAESEELQTAQVNLDIQAALRVAYVQWKNSLDQVLLEQSSVEAANKALEIAKRQFEIGTITSVEFRIIQLNAVNAEVRLLESQYIAKSREINMLRISGNLLDAVL